VVTRLFFEEWTAISTFMSVAMLLNVNCILLFSATMMMTVMMMTTTTMMMEMMIR